MWPEFVYTKDITFAPMHILIIAMSNVQGINLWLGEENLSTPKDSTFAHLSMSIVDFTNLKQCGLRLNQYPSLHWITLVNGSFKLYLRPDQTRLYQCGNESISGSRRAERNINSGFNFSSEYKTSVFVN